MMQRPKRQDSVQLCDENCRYRRLYEGSQRSLTEMASRQAQAVSRVGRLRNQLVLAAKRAFPRAFGEAERSMGKRMSEVTDEILVAYLESFMGTSILAEEPEGVAELRQALNDLGVFVPAGADLKEWAEAIRRHGDVVVPGSDQRTRPMPAPAVAPARPAQPLLRNRDLLAVVPKEDFDLDDLFEPIPTGAGSVTAVDAGEAPEAAAVASLDTEMVDPHPFEETHQLDDAFANGLTGEGAFDVADVFGGESIPGGEQAGSATEEFVFEDSTPTGPTLEESTIVSDANPAAAEKVAETDTAVAQPSLPAWATGKTVKPQLFPTAAAGAKPAKRARKQVRTRATAPDVPEAGVGSDVGTGSEGLTEEIRAQLMAAIAVPRPVFTSDLAAIVGGDEIVSAWRDDLQSGDLTVRFVLPKPRHRARGSLVIPQATLAGSDSNFSRSHWARCMEAYRGARIYEMGVFFHRFVEQVISFESDGETVAVRMSLPNGLTGAVLVAGQDLAEGGATRVSITGALDRLLRDRLVHVAVLVLNAEQFEAVRAAVEEEAKTREWAANMPVTLSRSWEYVDGTGTAIPLLGV